MATRRTKEFLDGNKVKYVHLLHSPAHTAQEVAASTHIPGRDLAKCVVVKLDDKLALAVVSANSNVDMTRLRAAAGAPIASVAEKSDFADRFEGCQLGTMPPFGNLFGMETYVDNELAKQGFIVFNAGSHTDLIAMDFGDFRRLVHPRMVNIATSGLRAGKFMPCRFDGMNIHPDGPPGGQSCRRNLAL